MLRLALPVAIEQLMIMLVTWTDHYLTAQYLETHHLAAINLMAYVLWVLPSIFGAICGSHCVSLTILRCRRI